jgi:single-strand DNA-binding protein
MDFNKVFVAGRLTQDPEITNLPGGTPVCDFRLAINRRWNDPDTGEKREEACFIDVKCYGKRAPVLQQHLRKGRNVLVEGRLRMDRWEVEGKPRTKHLIILDGFQFMDPPPQANGGPVETAEDEAEQGAKPLSPADPSRAGSVVARRRREKVLAGAAIDPAQAPF